MIEVVAALIWDKDKFLICQRPANKARALLWEFVGGKVEKGETKEQALIRECKEELNIVLNVGDVFMEVVHEYPDITVHLTLFNATIAEGVPQKLEHNDIKWITPAEISNYNFCPADEEILEKHNNEDKEKSKKRGSLTGGVRVKGIEDVAVRFSKCCSPVPGDEIVGFITRGRGISIHRTDCPNLLTLPEHERARMIEAEWEANATGSDDLFSAEITIYANDRQGVLFDITKIFTESNINMSSINTRTNKQGMATISVKFYIKNIEQLNTAMAKLRSVESVIDIERNAG